MQRDEKKLGLYFCNPPEDISLDLLDTSAIPAHISIIMDGNGRWATARGLDRSQGHKAGVKALRETITACVRLGVDVLSCYAFSTENWKRPQAEVNLLMRLFADTLLKELPLFEKEHVQLRFLGDLAALPKSTRQVFEEGLHKTSHNTGMVLALAVNYGSRAEIVRAAKVLIGKVEAGEIDASSIDEKSFAAELYTQGLPDPDIVIRTSGEMRLSNYLLWQVAYSEFYLADCLWPDFGRWELLRALAAYQKRDRRFGGVNSK